MLAHWMLTAEKILSDNVLKGYSQEGQVTQQLTHALESGTKRLVPQLLAEIKRIN